MKAIIATLKTAQVEFSTLGQYGFRTNATFTTAMIRLEDAIVRLEQLQRTTDPDGSPITPSDLG